MNTTPVRLVFAIVLILLLPLPGIAEVEQSTNDTMRSIVSTSHLNGYLTKKPDHESSWWDYMSWYTTIHGQRSAQIELGYSADFGLLEEYLTEGYGNQGMNNRIEEIFEDSLLNGLRDSFLSVINLGRYENVDRPVSLVGSRFIQGSIGGTLEEERRDALSLQPDDANSLKRWIESFTTDHKIQFGIKAFDTAPYGYMSWAVGSQYGGKPLLVSNTRIHSMLTQSETGLPRLKQEFVVPVGNNVQLVGGTSIYPTRFDDGDFRNRYSARINIVQGSQVWYASCGRNLDGIMTLVGYSRTF